MDEFRHMVQDFLTKIEYDPATTKPHCGAHHYTEPDEPGDCTNHECGSLPDHDGDHCCWCGLYWQGER